MLNKLTVFLFKNLQFNDLYVTSDLFMLFYTAIGGCTSLHLLYKENRMWEMKVRNSDLKKNNSSVILPFYFTEWNADQWALHGSPELSVPAFQLLMSKIPE